MNRRRIDLQERILQRLRAGDRLGLRQVRRSTGTFVRLGFPDGETVDLVSLESMVRRGVLRLDDDGQVTPNG